MPDFEVPLGHVTDCVTLVGAGVAGVVPPPPPPQLAIASGPMRAVTTVTHFGRDTLMARCLLFTLFSLCTNDLGMLL